MGGLEGIRKEIDEIDVQIVELLKKRMGLMPKVAEYKKENNLPREHPEREQEIIEGMMKIADEAGMNPEFIKEVFEVVIKEGNHVQKDILGE